MQCKIPLHSTQLVLSAVLNKFINLQQNEEDGRFIPIYIQQDATLHSLLYLETALHVLGGTSTHHQERMQLYLQHLPPETCRAVSRYNKLCNVASGWINKGVSKSFETSSIDRQPMAVRE